MADKKVESMKTSVTLLAVLGVLFGTLVTHESHVEQYGVLYTLFFAIATVVIATFGYLNVRHHHA